MPAGGTDFYLNTAIKDTWPPKLNASSSSVSSKCITMDTASVSRDWDAPGFLTLIVPPKSQRRRRNDAQDNTAK